MTYRLGSNVQAGEKIKTANGWRKIISVSDKGATVKEGVILFGEPVYGWKSK